MSGLMQTPGTSSASDSAAPVTPSQARMWDLVNKSGIVVVFLVLFAVLSVTVPGFLTPRNIQGLLLSVTLIGSIAVTMMRSATPMTSARSLDTMITVRPASASSYSRL